MNLLKRSSSWLWPSGHGLLRAHIVSSSASFSSLATRLCCHVDRFPYLSRLQKDLENMEPEDLMSRPSSLSYHTIFHRLQLSKLQSWRETEKCFDSIPESLRDFRVCTLFPAFYAQAHHLGKAKYFRKKGLIKAEIPLDVSREVDCLKLDVLMQEMVPLIWTNDTFNTRLYAYAARSDIEGMEKFLTKMESEPSLKADSHSYIIAANGYLEAGLADQVVKMMNKSEKLLHGYSESFCFETLLVFYTEIIMDKAHLHRVWNSYKETVQGPFHSSCYMCMISSLLKFDDMDGADKIFEEWDSWRRSMRGVQTFDNRIPNMMIGAYSREGLWEKAETCMKEKIVESGNEPDPASWDHLAAAYLEGGQMTKAVEAIKKAVNLATREWRLHNLHPHFEPISLHTLFQCFRYLLLRQRDARDAQDEIWHMIMEHPHFLEMTGCEELAYGEDEELFVYGEDEDLSDYPRTEHMI